MEVTTLQYKLLVDRSIRSSPSNERIDEVVSNYSRQMAHVRSMATTLPHPCSCSYTRPSRRHCSSRPAGPPGLGRGATDWRWDCGGLISVRHRSSSTEPRKKATRRNTTTTTMVMQRAHSSKQSPIILSIVSVLLFLLLDRASHISSRFSTTRILHERMSPSPCDGRSGSSESSGHIDTHQATGDAVVGVLWWRKRDHSDQRPRHAMRVVSRDVTRATNARHLY